MTYIHKKEGLRPVKIGGGRDEEGRKRFWKKWMHICIKRVREYVRK